MAEKPIKVKPLHEWMDGAFKPLIISGPCSAETEEQLLETASSIASGTSVQVLRAGVWKPRTRPNSFEGVGYKALAWLAKAKEATGLKTAVEVANADHVAACLDHGVDILWVGARSTASPFVVQSIADALVEHGGTDTMILVKNPVNPDLELWIGALERFHHAGVTKLGAIHRGFTSHGQQSPYRNPPVWTIPIELRRRFPDIPLICDPSHISGQRQTIHSVSQRALDLGMDGLMIESHRDPSAAWSDAQQQLTPEDLGRTLKRLIVKEGSSQQLEFQEALDEQRAKIDRIDQEILQILRSRQDIVDEIGELKRANAVTVLQTVRWDALLQDRKRQGADHGLCETYVQEIFEVIHDRSIRRQAEKPSGR